MTAGGRRVAVHQLAVGLAVLLTGVLVPALAQAAKPGDLDRSFGHDGWARTGFGTHDEAAAVAIDSKHRIVVAGSATYRHLFAVARYRPGGRPDRSFSGNGKTTTRFAGGPGYVVSYASSVVIDSRGRIVAAGTRCNWTAPPRHVDADVIGCEVALARYKENGRLDRSFGGDGKVTTDLGRVDATSVAIDSRNRIIVAGEVIASGDSASGGVARFTQSGRLDPSFGVGGLATPMGPTQLCSEHYSCVLTSVAIDSQGRIVVAGYPNAYDGFLVARFLPDGIRDPSFGKRGRVIGHDAAFALAVAINSKDQILAAGGTVGRSGEYGDFRLALYRTDGTPAREWGDDGEITTSFRDHYHHRRDALAVSAGFDSRGRVVAIGRMRHAYVLARYDRNGTLDRAFSGNGKATGPFKFPHRRNPGYVEAGTIDQRDRIVVAGEESDFLLARFIGSPKHR
jgi:uncharacterized delta-60 repeat protein